MTPELSPELIKCLESKNPVPHELVIELYDKFVEVCNKIQRPQAGRKKIYMTPEEAHQAKILRDREYRRKQRCKQPIIELLIT